MSPAETGRLYSCDRARLCFQLLPSPQRCLSSSAMLLPPSREQEFSSTLHRNTQSSPSHSLPGHQAAARFVPAKGLT